MNSLKTNNTNNTTNTNTTNKTLDIDKLEKALENNSNESIINLTTDKIKEMNWKIIRELKLEKQIALDYLWKLKGYKYVDELTDLKHGAFVRWIPITDPDYLPLNQCGIVCDIKIGDEGVFITLSALDHLKDADSLEAATQSQLDEDEDEYEEEDTEDEDEDTI